MGDQTLKSARAVFSRVGTARVERGGKFKNERLCLLVLLNMPIV